MAWQELENELTEDLIEYIKWGDKPEHKDLAEDAFIVFCFRFRDDIQRKCITIAANRGYDDIVADELIKIIPIAPLDIAVSIRVLRSPYSSYLPCGPA